MKLLCLLLGLGLGLIVLSSGRAAAPVDLNSAYHASLSLYRYDKAQPLAPKTVETKTLSDCRLLRFSYASTNGQRIPSLLFLPKSASKTHPVPCLVLLHGLGMSKEWMSGLAREAVAHGYASLAIDEYGQGERALPGDGPALTSQTLQLQLAMGVSQTVVDVRRGLDYLGTRPDINHARVGLVGLSLGAIIGSVAAGVDTRLKATVLVSGGGDWALILRSFSSRARTLDGQQISSVPNMDWNRISTHLTQEDPLTFAPHIAPRALLMENGRLDTIIVPQAAEELYQAARSAPNAHVQIDWYSNAGHVPAPELIDPVVEKWLAQNL